MIKKNKSKHSNEIGKKSVLRQIWQNKMAYLLLSPLIIGLLITCYYPPISGLYHSFFDWNVTGSATFIGLDNFKELFSDPVFLNSVPTLLKLMLPRLLISVVVPLIMAELILASASPRRGQLLEQMAVDFRVKPSPIDEKALKLSGGPQQQAAGKTHPPAPNQTHHQAYERQHSR